MNSIPLLKGFPFSDQDFNAISKLAYEDFGLHLRENKKALVYSRLVGRVRKLKLASFAEYCELLLDSRNKSERLQLLSSLTTNVTRFFREDHHFKILTDHVLPELAKKASNGKAVRLWSAGCSTGQEPYSLAIAIHEHQSELAKKDVRILASDVDTSVLQRAEAGVYEAESASGLTAEQCRSYFSTRADGALVASEKIKSLISFRRINLMDDWPISEVFDVIFCRNVAIYFDNETQSRLWKRFSEKLVPGGHMSIGHSERVSGPAQNLLKSIGHTSYTRVTPSEISNGT